MQIKCNSRDHPMKLGAQDRGVRASRGVRSLERHTYGAPRPRSILRMAESSIHPVLSQIDEPVRDAHHRAPDHIAERDPNEIVERG